MKKTCAHDWCRKPFLVTEEDEVFHRQMSVPAPTLCPTCRYVRRHGYVNDYNFHTCPCDMCNKRFVSIYPQNTPFRVVCQPCWFSESRDDKAEGRGYEESLSFFDQFHALMREAPQLGMIGDNNQNCEYSESVANCKNCYLISESSNCEDSYYCYWIQKSKNCVECSYCHECERCFQAIDCFTCYRTHYSMNCSDCSDSAFLDNCSGCRNCLFCTNLRQKQYYIFNKKYSKSDYEAELKKLKLGSASFIEMLRKEFDAFLLTQPRKALQITNCESCTGNYIRNAKNCRDVFHCYDAEDCAYGEHIWRGAKNCVDSNTAGRNAELLYETTNSGLDSYNVRFCRYCWGCRDTEYSNQCRQGSHLFGCVSLKAGAKYCILNKQYTEDQFHDLVPRIREKMLADGEYGEFFPLGHSLFGYNQSVSFDEFPVTREEAMNRGWRWEDDEGVTKDKGTIDMTTFADVISDTGDDVLNAVLTCRDCERNYRIIPQELEFHREENLPLPLTCALCRHRHRSGVRGTHALYPRQCSRCGEKMLSSFSDTHHEIVYCESCYLQDVY